MRPEKRNVDGVQSIFGTAGRDRTHLKNGIVSHSYACGAYDKYWHAFYSEALMAESHISWSHSPYIT